MSPTNAAGRGFQQAWICYWFHRLYFRLTPIESFFLDRVGGCQYDAASWTEVDQSGRSSRSGALPKEFQKRKEKDPGMQSSGNTEDLCSRRTEPEPAGDA